MAHQHGEALLALQRTDDTLCNECAVVRGDVWIFPKQIGVDVVSRQKDREVLQCRSPAPTPNCSETEPSAPLMRSSGRAMVEAEHPTKTLAPSDCFANASNRAGVLQ